MIGVIVLGAAAFDLLPFQSSTKAFKILDIGSKYSELVSIAGKPAYETDGTRWVEPQHSKAKDQLIVNCAKESWYEYWIKIFPSKYAFCFDDEDILINKYHWSSW